MPNCVANLLYLDADGNSPDSKPNPRTPTRGDRLVDFEVAMQDGREVAYTDSDLDVKGFAFIADAPTQISTQVLRDPNQVHVSGYYPETEQCVLESGLLPPEFSYALCFNHVNRKTSLKKHTLPLGDKSARGPVNDVHTDFAADSIVIQSLAARVEDMGLSHCRWMVLNCWRPAQDAPVAVWPLAVCDASSVAGADLVARESPENQSKILNARPSPNHRWTFFPNMTSSELLLFKTFESVPAPGRAPFSLHCAFEGPSGSGASPAPAVGTERHSVEARLLVIAVPEDDVPRVRAASRLGTFSSRFKSHGNGSKL